jgi:hypothetical protein
MLAKILLYLVGSLFLFSVVSAQTPTPNIAVVWGDWIVRELSRANLPATANARVIAVLSSALYDTYASITFPVSFIFIFLFFSFILFSKIN